MLEDTPETSELKIVAFFKNIWANIINLVNPPDGVGSCIFYHLPIIKYLARNTYYSRPSYITAQNFSRAIIEIFRRYGGSEETPDLQKIQNVLKGSLEYTGVLKEIKDAIITYTKPAPAKLTEPIDYVALRKFIEEKLSAHSYTNYPDKPQRKIVREIKAALQSTGTLEKDKAAIYKIDELLNIFGRETRSHITSLLKDADNDLVKFRLHLEQWFEDTMDRTTGWYKQKIQFILLIVGFVLAIAFNANTFVTIKTLAVDTDTRDNLVHMASNYANDPINTIPKSAGIFSSRDSLKLDSSRAARLYDFERTGAMLQKQMNDENYILGLGWPDLLDSLPLLSLSKEDSLKKLDKYVDVQYSKILLDLKGKDSLMLLLHKGYVNAGILSCLNESSFPFQPNTYTGYNRKLNKIYITHSWLGHIAYSFGYLFSSAFWGFFLTALAISMGAPFWFDLLSKLVRIRGDVKEQAKPNVDSRVLVPTSDPSHTINRKG